MDGISLRNTRMKLLKSFHFLNNGVRIRLIDQRTAKEEDFAFTGGVTSFVEYINRSKSCFIPIFYFFR